ncbi:hypothetical protein ACOSQ2_027194 [Xanthoceras sorbifolium]
MAQPDGFISSKNPDYVCRLYKSLYGLKQAPIAWFEKLKSALVQWGFLSSVLDQFLFIKRSQHAVTFILVYVDYILVTGSDASYIQQIIHDLNKYFCSQDSWLSSVFYRFRSSQIISGFTLTSA